jgi:hypothetical protein
MDIVISDHAKFEMKRRRITEGAMMNVAQSPQQTLTTSKGRIVHQSRFFDEAQGKEMLLRVVMEKRAGSFYVVTAYRTSKIDKYWQREG